MFTVILAMACVVRFKRHKPSARAGSEAVFVLMLFPCEPTLADKGRKSYQKTTKEPEFVYNIAIKFRMVNF